MWTRSIPSAELALWRETGQRQLRARVRRRGEVGWVNLSDTLGGDWVLSVRVEIPTPDQPVATFDVVLIRQAADDDGDPVTLSPGISAAPINLDSEAEFRPFLHPGREIEVDARVGDGSTWHPWRLWLKGEIEESSWPGDEVTVHCQTLDGVLMAAQIEYEEIRGEPDPGVAVEQEIQSLIDRWWPGDDAPTVVVEGTPDYKLGEYRAAVGSLGALVRSHAQRMGWDLRYLWDDTAEDFVLKLYLPPRSKDTPDYLLPVDEQFGIGQLAQSRRWVRNAIRVPYVETAEGAEEVVTVVDNDSITEYRRQAMTIPLSDGNQVAGTEGQATTLGEYAINDLSWPLVEASYRTRWVPWLELHDVLAIEADDARFDEDRIYSVVGGTHYVSADDSYTELQLRGGRPAGQYFAWHRFEGLNAEIEDPDYARQIYDVIWSDGDNGVGELSWLAGSEIDEVWVGSVLIEPPITREKWAAAAEASVPATSPISLTMPTESGGQRQLRLIQLTGYETAADGALVPVDVYRKTVFPKTSIPAIDDETGELRWASINSLKLFADNLPLFYPVETEDDRPADNSATDFVFVLETGTAYRWSGSGWVLYEDTPAVAMYPVLTAGIIKAFHVQIASLAELSDDLGIIVSGVLRNEAATRGIRLNEADSLPGTFVDYLDLAPADPTDPVLKVGGLQILGNGDTIVADEVEKTALISHFDFRKDIRGELSHGPAATRLILGAGESLPAAADLGLSLPVPAGATVTAIRLSGSLVHADNTLELMLFRADDKGFGTLHTLGTVSIFSVSDQTVQAFITPETIDASALYSLVVYMRWNDGNSPVFRSVEVVYTSHNYRQTL